jgi:hypothetical protein
MQTVLPFREPPPNAFLDVSGLELSASELADECRLLAANPNYAARALLAVPLPSLRFYVVLADELLRTAREPQPA